jgi:hypothetical protein
MKLSRTMVASMICQCKHTKAKRKNRVRDGYGIARESAAPRGQEGAPSPPLPSPPLPSPPYTISALPRGLARCPLTTTILVPKTRRNPSRICCSMGALAAAGSCSDTSSTSMPGPITTARYASLLAQGRNSPAVPQNTATNHRHIEETDVASRARCMLSNGGAQLQTLLEECGWWGIALRAC